MKTKGTIKEYAKHQLPETKTNSVHYGHDECRPSGLLPNLMSLIEMFILLSCLFQSIT